MPFESTSGGNATTQAILDGVALTSFEAILYFGFADMAPKVHRLRDKGYPVEDRVVSLAIVLARIEATLGAPVPARALALTEGHLTEYFISEAMLNAPEGARAAAVAAKAKAKADAAAREAARAAHGVEVLAKMNRALKRTTAKRLRKARLKRAKSRAEAAAPASALVADP